ncbi:MAG: chemotaxis protein CheA [Geminicoccaceae bacterium]|nr:chemotaxis protein CheA [Geminicoccaceae bacterium]
MATEDDFRSAYFDECAELVEELETGLTALDEGDRDRDVIDAVFRAVHSIKGGAGMFALDDLVRFAHSFETTLDMVRDGALTLDKGNIRLFLQAADMLSALVDATRDGEELPLAQAGIISASLEALATGGVDGPPSTGHPTGNDDEVGDFFDAPPDPADTGEGEGFGFFGDPQPSSADAVPAAEVAVSGDGRGSDDDAGWGLFLDETSPVQTAASAPPAGGESRRRPARGAAGNQSIRVDLDKIDSLVNQVGELVITQAVLKQQATDLPVERFAGLIQGLEDLALQTRELQESVMAVRAQPVKSVFSRMPRLVRELAQALGKEARLVLSGEATEVDKTVIEELADPLTHMIRNSMDHGLETPAERCAAGKPAAGTIHLGAEQRSGRILITVSDDGRGINRERVLEKARAGGIVAGDAVPSNEDIDQMIFAPGFSTAAAVSDVSGRGVGMDVVKRKIQDLGGRISISSMPGQGTRFTLMLPLTLAVLDGMIVRVGQERYIIPISAIVESLRPRAGDIHVLPGGATVMQMRGTCLPLVFLCHRFGIADARTDPGEALVIVVETEDGGATGVVVDDLIGQQQVVIKSLETNYRRVDGVAGATILGNGLVALILDVDALKELSDNGACTGRSSLLLESSEVH